jgi:type IV secretion system protein VirB10
MKPRHLALLLTLLLAGAAVAQQAPESTSPPPAQRPPDDQPAPATLQLPAGTRVLLRLTAPINTKSARPGDDVFAETAFPVTQNDRIVIPPGTYVKGTISEVRRPGRVHGRAQVLIHFNRMIFPSGYTLYLPGAVENVPGAEDQHVKDREGTIEQNGEKGKDVKTVATTAGGGAAIGAIAGGGKGAGIGAGIGGAAGLLVTLLSRGSDIHLPAGTSVDMVLERPLTIEADRIYR